MFPPPRLLPHCLQKLRREVADAFVVCPQDQYLSAAELALLQRVNVLERK